MEFAKFLVYISRSIFSMFVVLALIALAIYGFTHFSIWANYHSHIIKGGLVLLFVVLFSYMAIVYSDNSLLPEEKKKRLGG